MIEFRAFSGVKNGFRSGNELLRYEKLLYSPQKNWILPLNTAEIRRKKQVRQSYCNLYAYGANNPVRYIDPDGREDDEPIILKSWEPETPKKTETSAKGSLLPKIIIFMHKRN